MTKGKSCLLFKKIKIHINSTQRITFFYNCVTPFLSNIKSISHVRYIHLQPRSQYATAFRREIFFFRVRVIKTERIHFFSTITFDVDSLVRPLNDGHSGVYTRRNAIMGIGVGMGVRLRVSVSVRVCAYDSNGMRCRTRNYSRRCRWSNYGSPSGFGSDYSCATLRGSDYCGSSRLGSDDGGAAL